MNWISAILKTGYVYYFVTNLNAAKILKRRNGASYCTNEYLRFFGEKIIFLEYLILQISVIQKQHHVSNRI